MIYFFGVVKFGQGPRNTNLWPPYKCLLTAVEKLRSIIFLLACMSRNQCFTVQFQYDKLRKHSLEVFI